MSDDAAVAAYDALAPHYSEISRSRKPYLAAIERLIVEGAPDRPEAMLDVGAGDGRRATRIAQAVGARSLVLVEPSAAMASACRELRPAAVWGATAQELPVRRAGFDVVTCLWNVLGHVPSAEQRVEGLRRMRASLSDRGRLFVDVNHRYNARAYGRLATLGRGLRDLLAPSPRNGDVVVRFHVDGREIRCAGHVFTAREMERLFAAAGLSILRRHVVDYATGELRRLPVSGQLLYTLAVG